MVDPPADRPRPGLDIDAAYAPAAAPTDVERPGADDEAALGHGGARMLLVVAGVQFVVTTLVFFVLLPAAPPLAAMALPYGIVGAFVGLYVWARTQPYPALLAGLGLYVAIHLLAALLDPASITQGILLKVIVIGALVGSIRNIQRYRAS